MLDQDRRIARIRISNEMFNRIDEVAAIFVGTVTLQIDEEFAYNCRVYHVYHPSFDVLPPGCVAPMMDVILTRRPDGYIYVRFDRVQAAGTTDRLADAMRKLVASYKEDLAEVGYSDDDIGDHDAVAEADAALAEYDGRNNG